ncbi:MAG: nuclear transport factor 2 family protein [Gemmatimonadetes bacterium]|nr:nuclear transport factor 2 family protein [Gemmatimonadota bacterium]
MRLLAPVPLLLAFALLPSPARGQAAGEGPPEEVEAVKAVVIRLFDGMREADAAKVRSVFHPQARFVVVTERDGDVQVGFESAGGFAIAVGEATEVWDERVTGWQVNVDGRVASVWTDYVFYRGDTFSHCGIDSFEMVKTGEGWLITQLADTRRREGCPAP